MRSPIVLVLSLAAAVIARESAAGAQTDPSHYEAARAPHQMALDASLSDPAWVQGQISDSTFWDLTKHTRAPLRTNAYLLYDDRNLYVAFQAEQTGVPIVATQRTNNVG